MCFNILANCLGIQNIHFLSPNHRYLKEVDCSSGQFKSSKLQDKEYTINASIFFTALQKLYLPLLDNLQKFSFRNVGLNQISTLAPTYIFSCDHSKGKLFLCNGIWWPLFSYLHHNSKSLIIIFVHWTQLLEYWSQDTYYMLWIISTQYLRESNPYEIVHFNLFSKCSH